MYLNENPISMLEMLLKISFGKEMIMIFFKGTYM